MIKIEESYEIFMETLSRLHFRNLELSDQDLSFEIFEELHDDSHTFLHEWTVDRLIEGGLIKASLRSRILKLRESIKHIMEIKCEITLYRNDPEWKKIRIEANSIMLDIKNV